MLSSKHLTKMLEEHIKTFSVETICSSQWYRTANRTTCWNLSNTGHRAKRAQSNTQSFK